MGTYGCEVGQDDDRDCVEHVWRFLAFDMRADGSWCEYQCERCEAALLVEPGGVHPETV